MIVHIEYEPKSVYSNLSLISLYFARWLRSGLPIRHSPSRPKLLSSSGPLAASISQSTATHHWYRELRVLSWALSNVRVNWVRVILSSTTVRKNLSMLTSCQTTTRIKPLERGGLISTRELFRNLRKCSICTISKEVTDLSQLPPCKTLLINSKHPMPTFYLNTNNSEQTTIFQEHHLHQSDPTNTTKR